MNQDLERETSRSCRGSLMLIATAASLGSTSGDSSGASFFCSRAKTGNVSRSGVTAQRFDLPALVR